MALKRLLAPRSWEELDDRILVNDGIATTTYFVENFSYDLMPSLARILGEYAGRLHVAMYVRAPERAEVVEQAKKGSVARQASEMVRGAYGQIQDYKAAQEINATEELRARAEMGLETPRYLGMYLTVAARGPAELEELRPRFESHLRNQGVRFVCAHWQQEFAFRSAVPLGQRRHRFAGRKLTPDNFAALCPSTGATCFEPAGYLHAFLQPQDDALAPEAPLALDRLRGGNAPGASEALIGSPRSGKSVTLKTLALTWLAHNHTVIVVDPKAGYGPLAQWAGGEVVPLAGSQGEPEHFSLTALPNAGGDHQRLARDPVVVPHLQIERIQPDEGVLSLQGPVAERLYHLVQLLADSGDSALPGTARQGRCVDPRQPQGLPQGHRDDVEQLVHMLTPST